MPCRAWPPAGHPWQPCGVGASVRRPAHCSHALPPVLCPAQQEAAQGKSLADMVRSGWRADEAEVSRIAGELLDILQYLGSRRPPVIHRWAPARPERAPLQLRRLLPPVCCLQRRPKEWGGAYAGSRWPRRGRLSLWTPARRDVKPENIVVEGGRTGGRVFLVDFGGVQVGGCGVAGGGVWVWEVQQRCVTKDVTPSVEAGSGRQ